MEFRSSIVFAVKSTLLKNKDAINRFAVIEIGSNDLVERDAFPPEY